VAGPLTAVLLADQGADVIHVDPPGGPRRACAADAFFNRGKRRAILDLKKPAGLAAARRLAASADVVIENFRPGVLARLGLDLDAVRRTSPALITCSLPGFGADDPRAAMRGYEGVIAAATANCRPRAGEEPPGWDWERPTYSALPIASSFAAYLAATSIVMALIARRRTGRGQRVEVPLFDAMFTLIGHSGAYADVSGPRPPRPIHGRGAGAFRCQDGRYVQFDTSSARHLAWFARAAGLRGRFEPDLLDLAGNARPEVNERLHARLREEFLTRTAAEWEQLGNAAGAAIGFIRTQAEWIGTDQARRSHAVARVTDPEFGAIWCAGVPVLLSEFPDPRPRPRPRRLAGEDTAAVLAELAQAPPQAQPARVAPGPAVAAPQPGPSQPLTGIQVPGQLACASLAQTATYHQAAFMFDFPGYRPAEPRGYFTLGESPLQRYYRAADRWFFLGARPADVQALAAVTGAPEVARSAGAALEAALAAALSRAPARDLTAALAGAGIAAHAVTPVAELMTDAVVRDRGLSVTQDVAGVGRCTMPGVSPRLSDTPALVGHPPHRPGEDAGQVLASAGLAGRLDALERAWVVRSADLPPAWP